MDSCRTKDEIKEITYKVTDPAECENFYIKQHKDFKMGTEMACIKTLSPDKFLDKVILLRNFQKYLQLLFLLIILFVVHWKYVLIFQADIGDPVLQGGKLRAIVAYTHQPHDPIIIVKTKNFIDDECI